MRDQLHDLLAFTEFSCLIVEIFVSAEFTTPENKRLLATNWQLQ